MIAGREVDRLHRAALGGSRLALWSACGLVPKALGPARQGYLRAADIPGAFVAVREGGSAGATRLGLSHNLWLGPDGATEVAVELTVNPPSDRV